MLEYRLGILGVDVCVCFVLSVQCYGLLCCDKGVVAAAAAAARYDHL